MAFDERSRKTLAYGIGAFSVLIILVYYPVLSSSFINYDDPSYVTGNGHVTGGLSLASIAWAFSTFYSYNWHPLTWISHMLDVQLFGLNPAGHHLTSLLLHVGNSAVLFILLKSLTGSVGRSACVAALFALHPLHVESVAWVSERKDVLSTLFGFLAMLAYGKYVRTRKPRVYALCMLLFAASLMAKPMLVTLPFVLLLLDFWPLGRLRRAGSGADGETGTRQALSLSSLVLEKVPFIGLSLASSVITYLAQRKGGALAGDSSLIANSGNAAVNYVTYALKMFWPIKLAVFYPHNPVVPVWQIVLAVMSVVFMSVVVIGAARRLPYLAVGWLWYLGTLVPVVGFVRIGQHALADRYTYVPLIGLFILAVWGGADLGERLRISRAAITGALIAILAICSVLTTLQARTWHDSITLFRHALDVTEDNWLAHKNLAAALANRGNLEDAVQHASESLRIKPDPLEYVSQGWLYLELGRYEQALEACKNSLSLAPGNDKAHFIMGVAYVYLKDHRSALAEYGILRDGGSPYAQQLLNYLNNAGIAISP